MVWKGLVTQTLNKIPYFLLNEIDQVNPITFIITSSSTIWFD